MLIKTWKGNLNYYSLDTVMQFSPRFLNLNLALLSNVTITHTLNSAVVSLNVFLPRALMRKRHSTKLTDIWPFASMRSHMRS